MKREKIRHSFETMTPDQTTKEQMLEKILNETQALHEAETNKRGFSVFRSKGFRLAVPAVLVLAAAVLLVTVGPWKHRPENQPGADITSTEESITENSQTEENSNEDIGPEKPSAETKEPAADNSVQTEEPIVVSPTRTYVCHNEKYVFDPILSLDEIHSTFYLCTFALPEAEIIGQYWLVGSVLILKGEKNQRIIFHVNDEAHLLFQGKLSSEIKILVKMEGMAGEKGKSKESALPDGADFAVKEDSSYESETLETLTDVELKDPEEGLALAYAVKWITDNVSDCRLFTGKVLSAEKEEDRIWIDRLIKYTPKDILMDRSYYVAVTYGVPAHYDEASGVYVRKTIWWDSVFYVGFSEEGDGRPGPVIRLANGLWITGRTSISKDEYGEPFLAERGFSHQFSGEDIEDAKAAAETYFYEHFTDCTLWQVWYPGDEENDYKKEEYSWFQKDEIMILYSSFEAGPDSEASFAPDAVYTGWMWIMGRNIGEPWEVLDYGF